MTIGTPNLLYNSPATGGQQSLVYAASYTTGSFTPDNNSLLVVIASSVVVGNNPQSLSISDSAGLTWSTAVSATYFSAGAGAQQTQYIFYAKVATGISMTVTISGFGTSYENWVQTQIFDVTGYNTSTPIGATGTGNSQSAGAVSVTLGAAPASTSLVCGALTLLATSGAGHSVVGTGFTALFDVSDSAGLVEVECEYKTGTTSTTVPWATQLTGSSLSVAVQTAFEIKASAGGGGSTNSASLIMGL
jgi:hypothetical protein